MNVLNLKGDDDDIDLEDEDDGNINNECVGVVDIRGRGLCMWAWLVCVGGVECHCLFALTCT